ncbi:uncharacterized protein LOC125804979 [Astyanax mexicanus]|uniref:uncharacterized protein LOC125804979 n=1 Tax=Astyanax mexicanus TaxID=7994 RepID=UPI0020CACC64|nr:uncharacterized protein LOC125804979 [Astyanax mexicanus]
MNYIISWNVTVLMGLAPFRSVNMPLSVVSILIDIFYIFCMLSPGPKKQRMKQPLLVLLGFLVGSNTALNILTFLFLLMNVTESWQSSDTLGLNILAQCLLFTMRVSINSCLWLNVFYYCQIVPARHPFLIALKRNIRPFVYSVLILDKFIFLNGFIVNFASYVLSLYKEYNSTKTVMINNAVVPDMCLRVGYFFFSVCMMLASGCATISYLRRHMRNMEKSSRSSARLQSQLRVTITGIVQTLLYFLCSAWLILDDVAYYFTSANFDPGAYIISTVVSLYSFGTNINLGVGQAVFREQVILIWQNLLPQKLSIPSTL